MHACKCPTRQAKETYTVALVDNDSAASMRSVDPRGRRITTFWRTSKSKHWEFLYLLPSKRDRFARRHHQKVTFLANYILQNIGALIDL